MNVYWRCEKYTVPSFLLIILSLRLSLMVSAWLPMWTLLVYVLLLIFTFLWSNKMKSIIVWLAGFLLLNTSFTPQLSIIIIFITNAQRTTHTPLVSTGCFSGVWWLFYQGPISKALVIHSIRSLTTNIDWLIHHPNRTHNKTNWLHFPAAQQFLSMAARASALIF